MDGGGIKEELEYSVCTVVVACSNPNHKSTLAINKCMDDYLPPNQTYLVGELYSSIS